MTNCSYVKLPVQKSSTPGDQQGGEETRLDTLIKTLLYCQPCSRSPLTLLSLTAFAIAQTSGLAAALLALPPPPAEER